MGKYFSNMAIIPSAKITIAVLLVLLSLSGNATAATIHIAVASNFVGTIKALAEDFEKSTKHKVVIVPGSTGKLYAQIKHGARFDIFLAADTRRPRLLEQENQALAGSRFTYAIGKIVLWSGQGMVVDDQGNVLSGGHFTHLAIANPKLAPYGKAAQEILNTLGLWSSLRGKLVRGENIGQTFQFVMSGNAELGFVALSQVLHLHNNKRGSYWIVPQRLYHPIAQQGVLLNGTPAARAFMVYLRESRARAIIRRGGYDVP